MIEWYSCSVCKMAHPWEEGDRDCPYGPFVVATGKTGVRMLEESGLLDRIKAWRARKWPEVVRAVEFRGSGAGAVERSGTKEKR